jgi:tRNA-(ms[2]io[6]A)-hydroxylase
MFKLRIDTDPEWATYILGEMDAFLLDHAACERKAAATGSKLALKYADRLELVEAMQEFVAEETQHFEQVCALLESRGLKFEGRIKDPYAIGLRKMLRSGEPEQLLDRLLLCATIEARSCERFELLLNVMQEGPIKELYLELTRSEARHRGLFVRLAKLYFPPKDVDARLDEFLDYEADLIETLPLRPAVH